jgi:RimJ/RimL family protein N-acetyltransferase
VVYNLWSDVETWLLLATVPFIPPTVEGVRRRLESEQADPSVSADALWLMAETVADPVETAVIGMAGLWAIDQFNRRAHVSLVLLPERRGMGFGTEMLFLLCRYAFRLRDLRRLELETLERNTAMRSLAERCGFSVEGRLRQRDYDAGRWSDVIVYGRLAEDLLQDTASERWC